MRRLALLSVCFAALSAGASEPAYKISRTVALGAPDRWDYLAFDAASHLVLISHGSEATLVDGKNGTLVGRLGPITKGHGVVLAEGRAYATSMEPNRLVGFDLKSQQEVARIPVGAAPDGAFYDAASHRAFVINEDDQTVTAIDVDSNKAVFTTALGGAPEIGAADGAGKIYVNIAGSREVVRIDIKSGQLEARWKVAECESPHGIAADGGTHRVFTSCVNGKLVVLDSGNGRLIASLPIGKRTDAVAFDAKRQRIFSSNSEGTLSVIQQVSAEDYRSLGEVPTAPGARTMALDPESGRVFLVTADVASSEPAEDGGRPTRFKFVPGSLKLLFLDPTT